MNNPLSPVESSQWFGHPKGLFVLFLTEMWERFSFYGMRGLLVFYLTKHFLFSDSIATGIYATYASLVYLVPVFGGLLADRYLGYRKSIIFGGVLLCIGHLSMAFEGAPAAVVDGVVVRDESALSVLYFALACIIVGVGFLKPNISSMVGQLYSHDDPRRDSGFTLFYMGINLGAVLAALTCGYLGETYGWKYGFGLAGFGMLIGLVTFIKGQGTLRDVDGGPPAAVLQKPLLGPLNINHSIYLGSALAIVLTWWLVQQQQVVGYLLGGTSLAVLAGIIIFAVMRCTATERNRLMVLLFLTAVSVVFWALFEQAGSSMSLFADRVVDREILGFTIKPSQLQFINPAFIILLAPIFSVLWVKLAQNGREPGTATKFALAVLQVGLGFGALVYGASIANENGQVALLWLVLAYFFHTTGELCLSPVGLSMVTKLSVPRIVGLMMGVWFLSSSVAHYIAGWIAALAEVSAGADGLSIYSDTFWFVAKVALVVGVLVLISAPFVNRVIKE